MDVVSPLFHYLTSNKIHSMVGDRMEKPHKSFSFNLLLQKKSLEPWTVYITLSSLSYPSWAWLSRHFVQTDNHLYAQHLTK